MKPNTLFLRLEGPMQAWGDNQSKFVIRRSAEAPTKSGVIGLLCAAMGLTRERAETEWLDRLVSMEFGVRIDMPGVRWWDYHTVGARMQMQIAEGVGKTKPGALLTRREYLCDASFLVALRGDSEIVEILAKALKSPIWTPYLGRKCCPPSRPIDQHSASDFPNMIAALTAIPWQRRLRSHEEYAPPPSVDCLMDWRADPEQLEAPDDALIWYDVPQSLNPPYHLPRFVVRETRTVGRNGILAIAVTPAQRETSAPARPRANYTNSQYRSARATRLLADYHLCVFCKSPATTVQHITYRRAGGSETKEDLRSLCRLCHDAVTMIEYGMGMGLDRINPEEPLWRERIIQKRDEIIKFRSLETRRRRLSADEVE